MAREFEDAVTNAAQNEEGSDIPDPIDVDIDGRIVTLEFPGSGQLAYMAMASAGDRGNLQTAGMVINFLVSLMEDDDARYLRSLLLTKGGTFGLEELLETFDDMMEQWGSRPTEPSSASASSRPSGGRSGTAGSRRAAPRR